MYKTYVSVEKDAEKDYIAISCKDVTTGEDVSKDDKRWKEDKLADFSFVSDQMRKMVGKVLTIIDASIADKRQNKAAKDLVRNMVSQEYEYLSDMMFDQEKIRDYANRVVQERDEVPEPIDILEAIGVEEEQD